MDLPLPLQDLGDRLELEVRLRRDDCRRAALPRRRLPVLLLALAGSRAPPGNAPGSGSRRPCGSGGTAARVCWKFDCLGFSPSANLIPSGALANSRSSGAAAAAPLHGRVLAADRVRRAVEDVRRGRSPGELPVDTDVERIEDVPDPDLRGDRARELVDLAVDRGVRVRVDDPGGDVLSLSVDFHGARGGGEPPAHGHDLAARDDEVGVLQDSRRRPASRRSRRARRPPSEPRPARRRERGAAGRPAAGLRSRELFVSRFPCSVSRLS